MFIIVQQHLIPLVFDLIPLIDSPEFNIYLIFDRLLRLSLPNTVFWLLMFYNGFHAQCNIVAEILKFGDRRFYDDWWNAKTFSEYWRLWNKPVHNWLVKHIYNPLRA